MLVIDYRPCFVNFAYPPAQVIWSNYKKDIDAWQGALEHKESYMRHFLEQTSRGAPPEGYETSKLAKLLDALISEASLLNGSVEHRSTLEGQ